MENLEERRRRMARERYANRQAKMSPERLMKFRRANAERTAARRAAIRSDELLRRRENMMRRRRRANETPEQYANRLAAQAFRQSRYRSSETPEQTANRLAAQAARQLQYRSSETPEQTANRLAAQAERQSQYRSGETPEQTANRLAVQAARQSQYRRNGTPGPTSSRFAANAIRRAQVVPPPVPVKLIKVLAVGQLQSIVGQGSAMQYGRNVPKESTKAPPPSTEAESDPTSDNEDVEVQIDCHPDILVKEEIAAEDSPDQEASDPLADTIAVKEVDSDVSAAWEDRTDLEREENEEAPTPVPVKLVHVFTGKEVHSDTYPASAMCEEENLGTSDTEVPMVIVKTEPIDVYDEEAEVQVKEEGVDSCGSS